MSIIVEPPVSTQTPKANIPGRFGIYGGRYVPETLMAALEELERAYAEAQLDPAYRALPRQAALRAAGRGADLPQA
jgi:tryptophan synthase beta chain